MGSVNRHNGEIQVQKMQLPLCHNTKFNDNQCISQWPFTSEDAAKKLKARYFELKNRKEMADYTCCGRKLSIQTLRYLKRYLLKVPWISSCWPIKAPTQTWFHHQSWNRSRRRIQKYRSQHWGRHTNLHPYTVLHLTVNHAIVISCHCVVCDVA